MAGEKVEILSLVLTTSPSLPSVLWLHSRSVQRGRGLAGGSDFESRVFCLVSESLLSLRDRSQRSAEMPARPALVCDKPAWRATWAHLHCYRQRRQQQKVLLCRSLSCTGTPLSWSRKPDLSSQGLVPGMVSVIGSGGLSKSLSSPSVLFMKDSRLRERSCPTRSHMAVGGARNRSGISRPLLELVPP